MAEPTCRGCRHFDDDPASIEDQLPGLTILGSAHGSARGAAGICRALDRFLEPVSASGCPRFEARGQIADQ